ncbi:hypothetical protein [Phenylobacterium sp.]|uniref:hypothetical protein n=1 Tax=Phenylobacterium sp. TaxID=1871053 RepID=UPI0030036285
MEMKSVLAIVACLSLAACATQPSKWTDTYELGKAANGPPLTKEDAGPAWARAEGTGDGATKARYEVLEILIRKSDILCENYLVGLSIQRNSISSGLDIAGLAFSTAGSLTTPARSANLLSGISTAFQGSRQKLTDNIFGGREYPLLYAAVKEGRRQQRKELMTRIERRDFDEWDPESILTLVQAYNIDCGINYGLHRINTSLVDPDGQDDRDTTLTSLDPEVSAEEDVSPQPEPRVASDNL